MLTSWERKAQQLLRDERGREALKKVGGIDVEVVGEGPDPNKPVVVVMCPTYRAPEPQMRDSLTAMVRHTHEVGAATVYSAPPVQSSVVHWSRNWLLCEQLKSGKPWTHALFIDDDMVVEPDYLVKLLSHKKDIIAGICTRRTDPPVPNIRRYDPQSATTKEIWEWPDNALISVDAVGTGFMLISMHAVEQVAQAYFDCLYEKEFFGMPEEVVAKTKATRLKAFNGEHKTCYWFRFMPTPAGDIEQGEDIFFCYMAKHYCGLEVFVDTSVQPGHLGNYPYSIKDFLPYRDYMIEKAKREGTYTAPPKVDAEIQLVG